MEQTAQGSGGATVPGGVQETWRFGTEGHGLVGNGVGGLGLDWMTSEVFSNFILWFCDSCLKGGD